MQADDTDVRVADHAAGRVEDGFEVEAELDALDAGVGFDVRLGRQVGVDAQGHRGRLAERLGGGGQGVQLVLALDVRGAAHHRDTTRMAKAGSSHIRSIGYCPLARSCASRTRRTRTPGSPRKFSLSGRLDLQFRQSPAAPVNRRASCRAANIGADCRRGNLYAVSHSHSGKLHACQSALVAGRLDVLA